MQAGKGGTNEVEHKGVKAVQDKAGAATAPGTAANSQHGGKEGALSRAQSTRGGRKDSLAAAAAVAAGGGGGGGGADPRPLSTRGGRGGATLVGQDLKAGGGTASGGNDAAVHWGKAAGGFFNRRSSAQEPPGAMGAMGLFQARRDSAPGEPLASVLGAEAEAAAGKSRRSGGGQEAGGGTGTGVMGFFKKRNSATGEAPAGGGGGGGGLFGHRRASAADAGSSGGAAGPEGAAGGEERSSAGQPAAAGGAGHGVLHMFSALGAAAQAAMARKSQVRRAGRGWCDVRNCSCVDACRASW